MRCACEWDGSKLTSLCGEHYAYAIKHFPPNLISTDILKDVTDEQIDKTVAAIMHISELPAFKSIQRAMVKEILKNIKKL